MSNISKAIKLQEAVDKLQEADALVQEALGATDSCYDTHCGIEDLITDLLADIEQLVEMQVTE